jgi:tryptophan synthase alpha chain
MTGVLPQGSIGATFARTRAEGRAAFIPYVTAGDPHLDATRDIVAVLRSSGADLIELGVPFSDPIADGPVNQRAARRALQAGVTLEQIIDLVASMHDDSTPPFILFTYFNPIHSMGPQRFAQRAADAGVSGVLVTDLPLEEGGELRSELDGRGVDLIQLLAPTSSEDRITRIVAAARGFLYVISRAGVTGARETLPSDLPEFLARVRTAAGRLPIAVGFGISRREQFEAVARQADGVVVGSAIVSLIEECGATPALASRIERLCHGLTGR